MSEVQFEEVVLDWLEAATFNISYMCNLNVSERVRFAFDPKNWKTVLFDCFEIQARKVDEHSTVLDMFGNVPFVPSVLHLLGADTHVIDSEFILTEDSQTAKFTELRDLQQRHTDAITDLQDDPQLQDLFTDLVIDPIQNETDPFPILKTGVHPETLHQYEPFNTLRNHRPFKGTEFQCRQKRIDANDAQPFGEYSDNFFTHVLLDPPYGVNYGDAFTPQDGVKLTLTALEEADRLLSPDGVLTMSFPKEVPPCKSEKWGAVWEARWRDKVAHKADELGFDTSALQLLNYDEMDAIDRRDIVALTR
jgi:hypothetical protein